MKAPSISRRAAVALFALASLLGTTPLASAQAKPLKFGISINASLESKSLCRLRRDNGHLYWHESASHRCG